MNEREPDEREDLDGTPAPAAGSKEAEDDAKWDKIISAIEAEDPEGGPMTAERLMKWAPLFDESYWEAVAELRGPNSVHNIWKS